MPLDYPVLTIYKNKKVRVCGMCVHYMSVCIFVCVSMCGVCECVHCMYVCCVLCMCSVCGV